MIFKARPVGLSNGLNLDNLQISASSSMSDFPASAARLNSAAIPTGSGYQGGAFCASGTAATLTFTLPSVHVITHISYQVGHVG